MKIGVLKGGLRDLTNFLTKKRALIYTEAVLWALNSSFLSFFNLIM